MIDTNVTFKEQITVLVLLHTTCSMCENVHDPDAGAGLCRKQKGGTSQAGAWLCTLQYTCTRTSQPFLEAGKVLTLQDAMRQPPMPGLFVDHCIVVCPIHARVRHCDGFPPSRVCLQVSKRVASTDKS